MKLKPRTVELVKLSYQPTKAELEEKIVLDIPDETIMLWTGNLGMGVLRPPISTSWIKRHRNRR